MLNILGYRRVLGVITGSSNSVVGPDLAQMSITGVTSHISDAHDFQGDYDEVAGASRQLTIGEQLLSDAARRLAAKAPQGAALMLDSEFFCEEREAVGTLESVGIGTVARPREALAAAVKQLGIVRVAMISPFFSKDNEIALAHLKSMGLEPVRSVAMAFQSSQQAACTTFLEIRERFEELVGDDVDAYIQLGHNLPLCKLVDNLEEDYGKPVLAINHVTYWHLLRQSGINDVVPKIGELFIHH